MSAALKLEIYQNGEFLKEIPCEEKEVWIGRDEDCVIRLEDRAISRKHGSLTPTARGVDFEKKSKFGQVRFNGKEIEHASLKNGDRLELGQFEIRIKHEVAEAIVHKPEAVQITKTTPALPENEIHTTAIEASPSMEMEFGQVEGVESVPMSDHEVAAEASSENQENTPGKSGSFDFAQNETDGSTKVFSANQTDMKAVLSFSDGAANVSQYEITDVEVAIGRSQKCHVVLEDKRSSRKHSLIVRDGSKYVLKDLGSANGTLLNGERIVEQHDLTSGDVIQIGDTQFTFQMMQADYHQKKDQFIQVAHEEPVQDMHPPQEMAPQMMPMDAQPFQPMGGEMPPGAAPAPDFAAPAAAEKKSFIGKFLDRYRAMNTKQQAIYGVVILGVIYLLLFDDDAPQKKAHLNMGDQKASQKKVDKKPGMGQSFESLTPEQQHYVQTEYQLAFDFYKNREYDNALLEIGKIFSLVENYKNAREIEAFAREGKRKLESQEEERKKKETERQAQIKLQNLLDQAGMLMEKKRYSEAEPLFSEIELLQPENAMVAKWQKQMVDEKERIERDQIEYNRVTALSKTAWEDFKKAKLLAKDKKYWDALDQYDELATRVVNDKKFVPAVKAETKRVEHIIASQRNPVFAQAKQLEADGKMPEAYRAYQKTYEIDPTFTPATEGMARIRGTISGRVKSIYAEGVFAESYSDFDTAEKRYREVMDTVPSDDPYYVKADSRLRKLTVFRHPAATTGPEAGGGGQ